MAEELRLIGDVLDAQLYDSEHRKIGRVDGLVLIEEDGQARLAFIEIGSVTRARRLGEHWRRWAQALNRKLGICRDAIYRIAWSEVESVDIDVELTLDARDEPPLDWERWIRTTFISKVPFS